MPLAKRICAILDVDEHGKPRRVFEKGGLQVDFVEAIANFLEKDGADEIWLRLEHDGGRGPNALYAPLSVLEKRVFSPIVTWSRVPSAADARLLLEFGADRVVVDVSLGGSDPLAHVQRIVEVVGSDRIVAALPFRRTVTSKGVIGELVDQNGTGLAVDVVALAERLVDVGAAEVLLIPRVPAPQSDRRVHDGELIEQIAGRLSIPVLSAGEDKEIADLATPLVMGADGVVTPLFSTGTPTVLQAKEALRVYDIALRPA